MKYIKLTNSPDKAIVDDNLFGFLSLYSWCQSTFGYPVCCITGVTTPMHTLILNIKGVDHRDNNPLNNQILNLRACTQSQNLGNRKKFEKGTYSSKYKGVSYVPDRDKYRVSIMKDRKKYSLGMYNNEIQAAKVYDHKARELFGEFASLNFPSPIIIIKNEVA